MPSLRSFISAELLSVATTKEIMTYWQENYAFIKDVYDSRSSKLEELMEKTDNAISAVLADKIYTSNEFKKIQEAFMVKLLLKETEVKWFFWIESLGFRALKLK